MISEYTLQSIDLYTIQNIIVVIFFFSFSKKIKFQKWEAKILINLISKGNFEEKVKAKFNAHVKE